MLAEQLLAAALVTFQAGYISGSSLIAQSCAVVLDVAKNLLRKLRLNRYREAGNTAMLILIALTHPRIFKLKVPRMCGQFLKRTEVRYAESPAYASICSSNRAMTIAIGTVTAIGRNSQQP